MQTRQIDLIKISLHCFKYQARGSSSKVWNDLDHTNLIDWSGMKKGWWYIINLLLHHPIASRHVVGQMLDSHWTLAHCCCCRWPGLKLQLRFHILFSSSSRGGRGEDYWANCIIKIPVKIILFDGEQLLFSVFYSLVTSQLISDTFDFALKSKEIT